MESISHPPAALDSAEPAILTKACRDCKLEKPLADFDPDGNNKDGHGPYCNPCRRARRRSYYEAPGGREKARAKHVEQTYGLSPEEYCEMIERQNNRCAACGNKETKKVKGTLCALQVDHDHKTGRVRGLLCSQCNVALGHLRDSERRARGLVRYIATRCVERPEPLRQINIFDSA